MVMDHFLFDVGFMFDDAWKESGGEKLIAFVEFARDYWHMPLRIVTREIVLWTFFMISGISNSFSKSNIRRGLQLMFVALIITIVTTFLANRYDAFIGFEIRFGVLHMIASCILIWVIIDLIMRDKYKTAAACFAVAIVVLVIYSEIDLIAARITDKKDWYIIFSEEFALSYNFSPGDYFPLIPHLGMFMAGAAIGPVIYRNKKTLLPFLDKFRWYRPVNFFGRHTLEIVILHQPLISALLAIISYLFITKGDFVIV